MARSDFKVVHIAHEFTATSPSVTKEFPVEGAPIADPGYLLLQIKGVARYTHKIYINNQELPDFDLPVAPGQSQAYQLWMDLIPPGYLVAGINTIRIDRVGNDNFSVRSAVVSWRE